MASSKQNADDRRKLALIIGNGDYVRRENGLSNSVNNAKELSNKLKTMNFKVTKAFDLNKHQMTTGIIDFAKTIRDGDLILFYFSGHGYQVKDNNYWIPVDDDKIESNRDIEDFAINAEQMFSRLVKRNQSYVTVLVLDCCRPYALKGASGASSMSEGTGLQAMKASDGTFIQFSCAADQTVSNDLFAKHLLKNITQENVDIGDMFRRIADSVYQESNRRQRPWSMNRLSRYGEICLNQVVVLPKEPPEIPLDQINPNEVQSIMKKQEELRAYYDNFPDIDDVTNRNRPDIQRAEEFTQSILSELPSGDVSERTTLCHVLNNLMGQENQCLFFDSTKGMSLPDASANLNDISFPDRPMILKLNNSDGLGHQKYRTDGQYDLRLIKTMDRMMEQNVPNPITDDILERLSQVHNTDKKNIEFKVVYNGSFSIVYTVKDLAINFVKKLTGLSTKLKAQFQQFKAAKIHPLLYRPSFDISNFDSRGNKDFTSQAGTFQVGPPGRTQLYKQPAGWARFGLTVLGRFPNDRWLHPFGDPENWYRAYHGTGRAKAVDFGKSDDSIDKQYASIDAAASIHETGFKPARVAVHGAGVYCSPNPTFPEKGYVPTVFIDTKDGKKVFKLMLQVAANPDGVTMTSVNDIWVVENPKNIRTYGLLIKEA